MNSKKTFANALNIGIEKARFIDHQSKEINQIIEELRSQIFLQTNGKVEVSVMDDASNYKSHSAVYDGPLFNIGTNKKILAAKNNEKTMRALQQRVHVAQAHALHVQRDNLTGFVLVEFLCSFLHELKILHNISPSDNSLGFGKRFQPRNGLQRQRMHGFPAAAQIVR